MVSNGKTRLILEKITELFCLAVANLEMKRMFNILLTPNSSIEPSIYYEAVIFINPQFQKR